MQRSPSAENAPGLGGTKTRVIPSSDATAAACSGPAPPNGTSTNDARSTARLAACTRTLGHAPVDQANDPSAAATGVMPSGPAWLSRARCAATGSSACDPPRKYSIEIAANEIGVGYGRRGSALAVTGRPGSAPALSGPTSSRPARSSWHRAAPAVMVAISSAGTSTV